MAQEAPQEASQVRRLVREAMHRPRQADAEQVITSMVSGLVTSRAFLASILESSTEYSIIAKDVDRRILSWNAGAQRNYGYSPAEVLGQSSDLLHDPEDIASGLVDRLHREARESGHAEGVFRRVRRDGTRFTASVVITPRHDAEGVFEGYLVISRDITREEELRQAAEADRRILAENDRRKDEFLATLAHELRNPLAPMAMAVELLERRDDDPDYRAQQRGVLQRQLRHLVRLVDDLLDVARISQGKVQLQREAFPLAAAVAQGVETGRPLAVEKGQDLRVQVDETLLVDGDPTRLAQVVGNLVQNAAKYTPPGGHIEVRLAATEAGDEARLDVKDDGQGIEALLAPRVFDLFVQGKAGTQQGGLGLGLALVRTIVQMHGGRVACTSPGPGKGTTFSVWLPLLAAAETKPAPTVAGRPHPRGPRRRRVLVVDDNLDMADAMGELLRTEGHDVVVVHDGANALRLAASTHPDVVICDLGMPGMDGFEVARRLRALPTLGPAVLVALSGYAQAGDRERSRAAGFDHHLAKASSLDRLLEIVAAVTT